MLKNRRKSGYILLITVIITMVITTVVLACSQTIRLTNRQLSGRIEISKTERAAKSAVNFALGILNKNTDITNIKKITTEFDGCDCEINIICDNGKFNINNLVKTNDNPNQLYIDLMANLVAGYNAGNSREKIQLNMIPAMIDAVDENDDVFTDKIQGRAGTGAEKRYYQNLNMPECKNQKLNSLAEAFYVKDFIAENGNDQFRPFIDCLTTKNIDKIDINSAPAEVILALSKKLNYKKAESLAVTNTDNQYMSVNDFLTQAEIDSIESSKLKDVLTVQPDKRFYSVIVKSSYDGRTCRIVADIIKNTNDIYVVDKYTVDQ